MSAKLKILVLALGLVTLFSARASADGFGFTFGKSGKHTSFGIEFTSGTLCAPLPPPRVVPCSPSVWVPAHYETVLQEVWVEGQPEKVWCAPVFEWRYDACGHAHKVLVTAGHWKVVCAPGHYETRRVQIWQPGHWQSAGPHSR